MARTCWSARSGPRRSNWAAGRARPDPTPAIGGIPSLRAASKRPPYNQVRSAITLMQHGLRSVVEFTLQLVQVALPKGRVIPEDFGEVRQLPAIDLRLSRP